MYRKLLSLRKFCSSSNTFNKDIEKQLGVIVEFPLFPFNRLNLKLTDIKY